MRHELKLFRGGLRRDLRTENLAIKNELTNMAKSLEFAFERIDEQKKKLMEHTFKNAELEHESDDLRNKCSHL